ncbi:glycosyl transferase [Rhodovulum sulfidophilum]|uniref:Glycosyltransferase family 2 protein n=1 Tax=Rhodovulum visakhapatnamense TaxID=364297 RepID=A0ABS1RAV9_9RHOB|nr:glycosyltransferase family 2 protein [Rhodovulum visakhapatnamense]MBL3568904.1 glycosyltransferase family 2 protein [Rhodovulum visakhapatnamense]MBL3576783.1 glycosyltransferase family 2 protein [Rhodovulum visakhapatnamense]OLS42271.1 glycosyl transferase [Rhodovulum sulfidophilum]
MTHRLVVSIINYRTADMTLTCLASVLEDLDGIDGHVVIVDNASGDGSETVLQDWLDAHPGAPVTLVRSAANTGFSGGHNQGMAAKPARFYLLLNSDAVLRPGFCRTILAAAEAQPEAGLFAPRILRDSGETQDSCFRFHSPLSELIRGANTGLVTRALRRFEVSLGTEPVPARIDWASFACILLRAEMTAALGPMDEGYFLYYEDAEYCLRARRAGWRITRVPEAVAVHFRGGSGPVKTLRNARKRLPPYYYASRARFLYQAHGLVGLWAANLMWHAGRGIALLRRLARRPGQQPPLEGEARDLWINAADPLGPRLAPHET